MSSSVASAGFLIVLNSDVPLIYKNIETAKERIYGMSEEEAKIALAKAAAKLPINKLSFS